MIEVLSKIHNAIFLNETESSKLINETINNQDLIATAIEKKKRTLVLTFRGKQIVFMNKFFPSLADNLMRKFFFKNGKLVK